MKRGLMIVLAAVLALSAAGCFLMPARASLNGQSITLSTEKRLGELHYRISDDFELVNETTGYNDKSREYRISKGGKDFWILIAEKSINLSWQPLQDEVDAINADPANRNCVITTKKISGKDRAYVTFDTDDPAHGGNVTKHYCYITFDEMGLRFYYRIEFINCSKDTQSFEDAFLKKVETT